MDTIQARLRGRKKGEGGRGARVPQDTWGSMNVATKQRAGRIHGNVVVAVCVGECACAYLLVGLRLFVCLSVCLSVCVWACRPLCLSPSFTLLTASRSYVSSLP